MLPIETDHAAITDGSSLSEGPLQRASQAARVEARLARQVDEAVSFRDAVRRAMICLIDGGDLAPSAGHQVVPAARTGGSEPLSPSGVGVDHKTTSLVEVLGAALHERSVAGDLQAATRVAEVVVQRSADWLPLRGTMEREHYIEATVDMAVAQASKSVFAHASKR